MLVTPAGIVTASKLLQPSNADLPMLVTPSCSTTDSTDVRSAYHGAVLLDAW